jgi:hypothetical protein
MKDRGWLRVAEDRLLSYGGGSQMRLAMLLTSGWPVIRLESRAQKVFAQTTAALTANPQVKLIGIINRCRLNMTSVAKTHPYR